MGRAPTIVSRAALTPSAGRAWSARAAVVAAGPAFPKGRGN